MQLLTSNSRRVLPALWALAVLTGLFPEVALAQDRMGCEYDDVMGSVRCAVSSGSVDIHGISINDGTCPVWDHRLVRAEIDARFRESGTITSQGEYASDEVAAVSEAVIESIRQKSLKTGDFFRFEGYRCVVKTIKLDTSAGPLAFRTQQ